MKNIWSFFVNNLLKKKNTLKSIMFLDLMMKYMVFVYNNLLMKL